MHYVHRAWLDIVQGDDSDNRGSQGGGNLRIIPVADVSLASEFEMMNFRVKRFTHLPRRTRKIDHHSAGVDDVHPKTAPLQPVFDCVEICLRRTESLT
jgi:hypothetical protein